MTENEPWATPPANSAQTGGENPQYGAPPPPPTYGQVPPPPPTYGQVPGAYYGVAPTSTAKDWMGVTSLVMSLASVIVGFTWIGGIIFGHMALAAAKRGEASNRGIALAGTIVGWVFGAGTILVVLFFLWYSAAISNASYA